MKLVKESVYVAASSKGFKFPPLVSLDMKDENGCWYSKVDDELRFNIPVTYVDPEDGDFDFTEDFTSAVKKQGVQSVEKIVKACKSGIRLAIGNAAKDTYAVEGGKKVLAEAQKYVATCGGDILKKWVELVTSGGDADTFALETWRSR